jgi:hypothetical protein
MRDTVRKPRPESRHPDRAGEPAAGQWAVFDDPRHERTQLFLSQII